MFETHTAPPLITIKDDEFWSLNAIMYIVVLTGVVAILASITALLLLGLWVSLLLMGKFSGFLLATLPTAFFIGAAGWLWWVIWQMIASQRKYRMKLVFDTAGVTYYKGKSARPIPYSAIKSIVFREQNSQEEDLPSDHLVIYYQTKSGKDAHLAIELRALGSATDISAAFQRFGVMVTNSLATFKHTALTNTVTNWALIAGVLVITTQLAVTSWLLYHGDTQYEMTKSPLVRQFGSMVGAGMALLGLKLALLPARSSSRARFMYLGLLVWLGVFWLLGQQVVLIK